MRELKNKLKKNTDSVTFMLRTYQMVLMKNPLENYLRSMVLSDHVRLLEKNSTPPILVLREVLRYSVMYVTLKLNMLKRPRLLLMVIHLSTILNSL
jgi:hypothetical protein